MPIQSTGEAMSQDRNWLEDESRREAAKHTVQAVIIAWCRKNGVHSIWDRDRVERQFPDVPSSIVVSAILRMRSQDTDAWLDQLANTIEGEIVQRKIEAGK